MYGQYFTLSGGQIDDLLASTPIIDRIDPYTPTAIPISVWSSRMIVIEMPTKDSRLPIKNEDSTARAEAVAWVFAPANAAVKAVHATTEKNSFQRNKPPGFAHNDAENCPAPTPPPIAQERRPASTMSDVKSVATIVG